MAHTDLSLAELEAYRPQLTEPADFDAFWSGTLAQARTRPAVIDLQRRSTPLRLVDVDDVTIAGFDGDPVHAWLVRPAGVREPLPVLVQYLGYGGGRGLPHQHLAWAAAGWAHLVMDTRGQGSVWGSGGDTPDPHGSGPAHPGVMTRGILDPAEHYYRRVFTDAVRAVDAVREIDGIDRSRVAVAGGSQGGGITLAVAGLVPDLLAAMPDVPFLCNFRRAVEICDQAPYTELTQYLAVHRDQADQVFRTLSYLDGAHFATRAHAPALFSVALMDPICPPSTVYTAYNRYAGRKEIVVYPYNRHEGGEDVQLARQLGWLAGAA